MRIMRFNTTFEIDGIQASDRHKWNRPEATKPTFHTLISHGDTKEERLAVEETDHTVRETRRISNFPVQEGTVTRHAPIWTRKPCADQFLELPRPIRSAYPKQRSSPLMRKVLGLLLALSVAIGLLGCIMDRLSAELDTIESELRRRNDIMAAKEHFEESSVHKAHTIGPERSSRRLAAAGVEVQFSHPRDLKQESGLWNNMKMRLWTLTRVASMFSDRNQYEVSAALFKSMSGIAETILVPSRPRNNTAVFTTPQRYETSDSPGTGLLAKAHRNDYAEANLV